MYSIRGDGRRICETSLRKYAQLNFSTPMVSSSSSSSPSSPSPLSPAPGPPPPPPPPPCRPLCEPPALPCAACSPLPSPSVLRRSPFTSSPSNSPSGLLPRPASIPLFLVAAYFFCLASLAPALGARLDLFHPSSPPPSALPPLPPPPALPTSPPVLARSFVTAPLFSRCPTLFATPRRSIIPQSRGV
jgi:hypothetical protein